MTNLATMPRQNPLFCVFPSACQTWIAGVLSLPAGQFLFLPVGQRQAFRLGGNAVPKIFDELNPFGQRQIQQAGNLLIHSTTGSGFWEINLRARCGAGGDVCRWGEAVPYHDYFTHAPAPTQRTSFSCLDARPWYNCGQNWFVNERLPSILDQPSLDLWHMQRALELAAQGEGAVEPNPMVGCVIARGAEILGEGWHRRFGGPHAEVEALEIARERARGATLYVTLEPCCHQGKTPPCTRAVLAAGIARVVAATTDPFLQVAGGGLAELRAAGVEVQSGVLESEARKLNAPYLKLLSTGRPWVIAKWAMTLDGKIATRSGDSRWISCKASRQVTHQLRGRVDAIVVGRGTAAADDPLLTARPPGPRTAVRVVLDTRASLSLKSQLVRTARELPVLVAASSEASEVNCTKLREAGCEVLTCGGATPQARLESLLDELGKRRMTNVLVEGGSRLLGSFFDALLIDEVHVFIAPKLAGGEAAPGPIAGQGVEAIAAAMALEDVVVKQIGGDVYLHGRTRALESRL